MRAAQLVPWTNWKGMNFTTLAMNDADLNIHELVLKMFRPSEQRNHIPELLLAPLICTAFLYTGIIHASRLMLLLKLCR
jgi:hypothetical protein